MKTHAILAAARISCSKDGGSNSCPICSAAVTFHKPRFDVAARMKIAFAEEIKVHSECEWRPLSPMVNGYKLKTLARYLCSQCYDLIAWKVEDWIPEIRLRKRWHANLGKDSWGVFARSITPEDSQYLKRMPYSKFLKTDYWARIRAHVLALRGHKCALCPATGFNSILDVHHRSYEYHGYEHEHVSDLIVLCRMCHQKHHDVLAREVA